MCILSSCYDHLRPHQGSPKTSSRKLYYAIIKNAVQDIRQHYIIILDACLWSFIWRTEESTNNKLILYKFLIWMVKMFV